MKMEQTEWSEMSAYKIQMLGNYPEESVQHSEHVESLKSRMLNIYFVSCFLLGSSPASEFYMPTFRNPLSVPCSLAGTYEEYLPAYEDRTDRVF